MNIFGGMPMPEPSEFNLFNVSRDIIRFIAQHSYLVRKIGIFGSLARGDYNDKSDIDLLIEYNAPGKFEMDHFRNYCALCNDLTDALSTAYGRNVDIVDIENGSVTPFVDESVEDEVVWL